MAVIIILSCLVLTGAIVVVVIVLKKRTSNQEDDNIRDHRVNSEVLDVFADCVEDSPVKSRQLNNGSNVGVMMIDMSSSNNVDKPPEIPLDGGAQDESDLDYDNGTPKTYESDSNTPKSYESEDSQSDDSQSDDSETDDSESDDEQPGAKPKSPGAKRRPLSAPVSSHNLPAYNSESEDTTVSEEDSDTDASSPKRKQRSQSLDPSAGRKLSRAKRADAKRREALRNMVL